MREIKAKLFRLRHFVTPRHITEAIFDGKYFQGIGFDVRVKRLHFMGFTFVTHISFISDGEWLRKLKIRMEKDDVQQALEKAKIIK